MVSPPAMKEFVLLKPAGSLSVIAFQEAWSPVERRMLRETEAGLAYKRNEIAGPSPGFSKVPFAVVAEATERFVSADRRQIQPPDFPQLDTAASVRFAAIEHVIAVGSGPVKFMSLLRRKPGLTPEEFSNEWRHTHADIVRSAKDIWRNFRGYRQNHVVPGTCRHLDGTPMDAPYDGIVEIWFETLADLRDTMMSEDYERIIRPDEQRFVDLPNTRMLATEIVPKRRRR